MELLVTEIIFVPVLVIFIYMSLFFVMAQILKNNSIVDIGWGLGFVIVALTTLFYSQDLSNRKVLVTLLVAMWGIRLFMHIGIRNLGKSEDFRYAAWRKAWGKWVVPRAFFQIFMTQGAFMYLIALGVIVTNAYGGESSVNALDMVGVIVFLIGFFFEAIGDAQLKDFVAKKKNGEVAKDAVMTSGLWQLTRHPNYFGEALLWWGIFIIALNVDYGYIALLSPLAIDFVLLTISLPLLEKKYEDNKNFQEYAKHTSKFIPLLPKR